jgi:hypothetical protein
MFSTLGGLDIVNGDVLIMTYEWSRLAFEGLRGGHAAVFVDRR